MQQFRKIFPPIFIAICGATLLWIGLIKPVQSQTESEPNSKITAALAEAMADNTGEPIRFIVRMSEKTKLDYNRLPAEKLSRRTAIIDSLQNTARASQLELLPVLDQLKAQESIATYQSIWIINAVAAQGTAEAIERIAKHHNVASIDLDHELERMEPVDVNNNTVGEAHPETWGLEAMKAPQVWHAWGITGTGVTVGIMDSGIQHDHPALVNNYRGRQPDGSYVHEGNWYQASAPTKTVPYDLFGHGTHVAGTAVGHEGLGMAPGAEWIAVAIADDDGALLNSYIYGGFEWLLAPNGQPELAPDIMNGSWGGPGFVTWFVEELNLLQEAGIITVFSAGNSGPFTQTVGAPGSYTNTITIGATDNRGEVVWFSSRGPSPLHDDPVPLVVAPGAQVYSSLNGNEYGSRSGTSMSAPHATGALALLLSAGAEFEDYAAVRQHVIDSAVPFEDVHPNWDSGYGKMEATELLRPFVTGTYRYSGILQSNGTPIPFTEVTLTTPTGAFNIFTDENGQYVFYGKPGNYEISVDLFAYEPYESGPLFLSNSNTIFNINLNRHPYGTLTGRITDLSGNPISQTAVTITTLDQTFELHTDEQGGYTAEYPAGLYGIVANKAGYLLGQENSWVYAGQTAEVNFSLDTTERILLIDAGQWSFRSRAEEYKDIFSELNLGHDIARLYEPIEDQPTVEEMETYDVVIWSDPKYSPGYVSASRTISNYLGTGGNLLIGGGRVAYYDYLNIFEHDWITSLAHSKPLAILTPTEKIYGRDGTEFEGIEADIDGVATATAENITVMDKYYTYQGELIVSHGQPHESYNGLGIKSGHCLDYNIVYLGVEITDLVDPQDQTAMLRQSLEWLNREKQDQGVRWMNEEVNTPIAQGEQVGYTFRLQNQSETLTTTFNISADGAWPTQVVSETITLAPCEIRDMTFTITVPSDLGKNVTNQTIFNATKEGAPDVTTNITVSHKTPATLLLVDDHRWFAQNDIYEKVLTDLGIDYDIWMTHGDLQLGSPSQALVNAYDYMIWYSAFDWFLAITSNEVDLLETYLDSGGRLFMTSQDFLYYNSETSLARNYFGIIDHQESITPSVVFGDDLFAVSSNITGSLPMSFDAFQNHGDSLILANRESVSPLVWHDRGIGGAGSASTDPQAPWRAVFWSVPFEKVAPESHNEVMASVIGWLGDVGESSIAVDNAFTLSGQTQTFTVTIKNRGIGQTQLVTVSNPLPADLEYVADSISGPAVYDSASRTFNWSGLVTADGETSFTYQAIPQSDGNYVNQIQIRAGDDLVPFTRGAFFQVGGPNLAASHIEHELGPMIDGIRTVTMSMGLNNTGDQLAQNITATAFIPDEMSFITDSISIESGSAVYTNSTVIWSGSLPPSTIVTVTAIFTSSSTYIDHWLLSNLRIDDAGSPKWFVYDPQFIAGKKAWFPFIGQKTDEQD